MATIITWGTTATFADALAAVTGPSTIQYIGTTSGTVSSWPGVVPTFPLTFTTSGQQLSFTGAIPADLVSPIFAGVTLNSATAASSLTLNNAKTENLFVNGASAVLTANNSALSGLRCQCEQLNVNNCTTVTSATYGVRLQAATSCWIINSTITGSVHRGLEMDSSGSLFVSGGSVTCTTNAVWGIEVTSGSPSSVVFDSVELKNNRALLTESPLTVFESCLIIVKSPSPTDSVTPTVVIDCLGLLSIFNNCRFEMLSVNPTAGAGIFLRQSVSNAKWLSSGNTFNLNGLSVDDVVVFTPGLHASTPPPQPVITAAEKSSKRLTITSSLTGTLNLSTTDGVLVAGNLAVQAGVPQTIFAKHPSSPLVSVFSTDQSSLPMLVTPTPRPLSPLPPPPRPSVRKDNAEEAAVVVVVGALALAVVLTGASFALTR